MPITEIAGALLVEAAALAEEEAETDAEPVAEAEAETKLVPMTEIAGAFVLEAAAVVVVVVPATEDWPASTGNATRLDEAAVVVVVDEVAFEVVVEEPAGVVVVVVVDLLALVVVVVAVVVVALVVVVVALVVVVVWDALVSVEVLDESSGLLLSLGMLGVNVVSHCRCSSTRSSPLSAVTGVKVMMQVSVRVPSGVMTVVTSCTCFGPVKACLASNSESARTILFLRLSMRWFAA